MEVYFLETNKKNADLIRKIFLRNFVETEKPIVGHKTINNVFSWRTTKISTKTELKKRNTDMQLIILLFKLNKFLEFEFYYSFSIMFIFLILNNDILIVHIFECRFFSLLQFSVLHYNITFNKTHVYLGFFPNSS